MNELGHLKPPDSNHSLINSHYQKLGRGFGFVWQTVDQLSSQLWQLILRMTSALLRYFTGNQGMSFISQQRPEPSMLKKLRLIAEDVEKIKKSIEKLSLTTVEIAPNHPDPLSLMGDSSVNRKSVV